MKIVFHGGNAANFRQGFEAVLAESAGSSAGHQILDVSDALNQPGELEHFETADVIVGVRLGNAEPIPAKLRLYQAPAAGTDAIDQGRLPSDAVLCNCFGHENAIAEYVMTALLMRHVPLSDADTQLRRGAWTWWAGRPGALRSELGSQTIGLLGYGHIGKAIGTRAKAFGMRVSVANRSIVPASTMVDESYTIGQITQFMASADIIVVSLPLLESTQGLVDASALNAMRSDAVIINVGRGPVIQEKALYEVLQAKRIGGAIIDTWYTYPNSDNLETLPSNLPFETLTNLVMTPHMSGWTNGTVLRRQQAIAENIRRLEMQLPLVNIVK
jgi:phosphoglycerate dehydrogenase-like enzyme